MPKFTSYIDYRAHAEIAGTKPSEFVTDTPANRELRKLVDARKRELAKATAPKATAKARAKKAA